MSELYLAGASIAVLILYYIYKSVLSSPSPSPSPTHKPMKICNIYIYPIKSLRATTLTTALATQHGFQHDRSFMLVQVLPDGTHKNMAVSRYPEMTRFFPTIDIDKGSIAITYRPVNPAQAPRTLEVPLEPATSDLERFDIAMHGSPTPAFKMPGQYSAWFTECFAYDVMLVYLGENRREVLFKDMVVKSAPTAITSLFKPNLPSNQRITFADCAPYLVVSATSLADVSSRLPPDQPMDVTKFRPNIVIAGAPSPWEEDFWRRIRIGGVEIVMMHNCVRCASVNIDYETGRPGTGESGAVLKKLQKDRRVDRGAKWSPVFGRYSFWGTAKSPSQVFAVGDEVRVVEVQKERSVFGKPILG
ncbi:MOSC-domain-containing protein [Massarina eburnea CBS 473.64]|uniref:MOSC-domain-containing protein n=1 Tax=Massarina eburnea CBS 473.64 TaxID=1395130 RepID=A0A6A6RHJ3_9PLEO|nr:MOSC-domain-containing protein [Massarina eburnea CBS 473.64]